MNKDEVIWERNCRPFANDYYNSEKFRLEYILPKYGKDVFVKVIERSDGYDMQGKQLDVTLSLSNKIKINADEKFDKQGHKTGNVFLPIAKIQDGKRIPGWFMQDKLFFYFIMEPLTKLKPRKLLKCLPLQVTQQMRGEFNSSKYETKLVGHEKADYKDGKFNDSVAKIVRIPHIEDWNNGRKRGNKSNLNKWL